MNLLIKQIKWKSELKNVFECESKSNMNLNLIEFKSKSNMNPDQSDLNWI